MSSDPNELWLLGIDGGGSKTLAWLARLENATNECTIEDEHVLGKGLSGPSNPQVVGFQNAINSVEEAVALAWESTGAPPRPVAVIEDHRPAGGHFGAPRGGRGGGHGGQRVAA